MKIASVQTVPLSVPLDEAATTRSHPLGIPALSYVLVRAETDEGLVGWGEMSDGWGFEYPDVAAALVGEALSRFVVGQDPTDVATLVERMWAWLRRRQGRRWLVAQAISGVEIALWDIVAKASDVSAGTLFGPVLRDEVPVYFSGNFLGQANARIHADSFVPAIDRGVGGIKVRIGADWEGHLEVLEELSRLLGPGTEIGVDGNEAFKVETALRIAERMGELGVAFFEEPTPRDRRAGLADLVARSPVPIAYGEHVHRAVGFAALEEEGPLADIWQPDVTVVGGFLEAQATFELAASLERPISPHSATTPLGFAANLHAAALAPTLTRVEYSATAIARLAPFFSGGAQVSPEAVANGALRPPEGPGIGLEPDVESLIEAYPVLPPTRIDGLPLFYTGSI